MNLLAKASERCWAGAPALALALTIIASGCGSRETPSPGPQTTNEPGGADQDAKVISTLVAAEETALVLNPKLNMLASGLMDLRLPSASPVTQQIFAPSVQVTDLAAESISRETNAPLISGIWPVHSQAAAASEVNLWRPLLDKVASFQHMKFSLQGGEHPDGDMFRFACKARFEGLAKLKSGEMLAIAGPIALTWERPKETGGSAGEWKIVAWHTEPLGWSSSPKPLFVETLDEAMRSPEEAAKLRRSQHYEAVVKYYREGMQQQPHPYFAPISVNQKEGLAIADLNGDGFDDIYLTVRLGKNMLLINQKDGTFVEQAAQYKLDLPGHTTCSLIADFDNDGDLDVMLGRSLLKSSYLENQNGVFVQHPIPPFMPMAAISMAAADYNRDGLLDVYICTYRPAAPVGASPAGGVAQGKEGDFDWPDEFLSPEQAREFRVRVAENKQRKGGTVLDQVGPPNILLVNRGNGRFEPAPENDVLGLWRNSLQATWGDYDEDGDPDLFVANDWALSALYRNDFPNGFTDVTEETGVTSYGFSMGASWGDYDNDGLEDVYVSNMHSEAGRRMSAKIPGLSRWFVESASGNWLYHRESKGKFKQVAGFEAPGIPVINAGWSWGGCFIDFNNDTFQDLYVLNGYFTAPIELTSDLDLESNLWRTMLRTDENLARPSFRFSPEWKRTGAPDNLGPQIDARLAGVDRQGNKVRVHSLQGGERNRFFVNRAGRTFQDISALSGLDNVADSRGFAVLDYDRDGWQDVALVNANQPLMNLYRNQMEEAGMAGGVIAIRFVGGNRTPEPSKEFACRDGYGARVHVDLGDAKLVREHRCGDGWSTQNSPTMMIGVGSHSTVRQIAVRWPSGKTATVRDVPEGTLLTVYEDPSQAPGGQPFTGQVYRLGPNPPAFTLKDGPTFSVAAADNRGKEGARLRVYTSFATTAEGCPQMVTQQKALKDALAPAGVEFIVLPIDPADDDIKLGAFAQKHRPSGRLLNLPQATRKETAAELAKIFAKAPPVPSSVVTDGTGRIVAIQTGLPSAGDLQKLLEKP